MTSYDSIIGARLCGCLGDHLKALAADLGSTGVTGSVLTARAAPIAAA